MTIIADTIENRFKAFGCLTALHVKDIQSGAEVALRSDEPAVAASVFKAIVALEFYMQANTGRIDPREIVEIDPLRSTPGPAGLSNFRDPARLSLRDLADLMMTISDNAATDLLIARLGLEKINRRARACGCTGTTIVSDLATMLDGVATDLGFDSYRTLLAAQEGRFGEKARTLSIDPAVIETCAALDPTRATRTTPRDMTRFLTAVWQDFGDADACQALREVMGRQVARRLESVVPVGGVLSAKSGSLFGRIRNEIGAITYPDGSCFAFAVFTRAHDPRVHPSAIHGEMVSAVDEAVRFLRGA